MCAEQDDVDLTLYVACYNEENNISQTLDEVFAALEEVGLSHDVIVVDDASVDNSVSVVLAYVVRNPARKLRLIQREHNFGLGQNFVDTSFLGRGKYFRLVCGDNVEPRQTLVSIFSHIGAADLIIPYHKQLPKGRTFFRYVISITYTFLVNLLSGHKIRYYNGLAIYRRYDVMRWHTYSNGFGFQADLTTRLLDRGVSYAEIPVIAYDRESDASTALTMKNFLSVGHTLLEIALRRLARALYGRGGTPPIRVDLPLSTMNPKP